MKFGSMPYLFNDRAAIARLLEDAGFRHTRVEEVRIACTCPSARRFATGQLHGTPRGLLPSPESGAMSPSNTRHKHWSSKCDRS